MQLHPLQQLVHVERRPPVVDADDDSERDEIRRQRIHEASAERIVRQRPAERVNDRVERLLRLPDLLHAEREDLRIVRADLLPLDYACDSEPRVPSDSTVTRAVMSVGGV